MIEHPIPEFPCHGCGEMIRGFVDSDDEVTPATVPMGSVVTMNCCGATGKIVEDGIQPLTYSMAMHQLFVKDIITKGNK